MNSSENDIIIGLEVHIQLTYLKTKMFCSCNSDYRDADVNSRTCPICIGLPGSLPVINEKAIEFATRLAIALNCNINRSSYFFRKNYFYPDLSKNFQISQYNKAGGKAFADGGEIIAKVNSDKEVIKLNRIHLEEDPARLVHKGNIAISPYTLVDYNRSGICLIEIVTEPVLKSPEIAREFLKQLKSIVQYTGISNLELEGAVRVDANISIKGHERSEVKNINSFKEVERALKWEIQRQRMYISTGKRLIQETRHWDDKRGVTIALRTKEFEEDYRYFPEQDLVPIKLEQEFIEAVKNQLPEMPRERSARFQKEYGLTEFDAENLVLDKNVADFYEDGINFDPSFGLEEYKLYCNWLMNNVSGWLNEHAFNITDTKLRPPQLVELINAIKNGHITTKIAKLFMDELMKGTKLSKIMKTKGKKRIADEKILISYCQEIISQNEKIALDCKQKPKAIEALIGKVMALTKGQADPELLRKIMTRVLEKSGYL
jgi:aspartyl-tRNA(Asn)/glutamyl-tRNA(Gln) amidotransferase subunit B